MMDRPPTSRAMTTLAWVFVAGAVLHLVAWTGINWYRVFGPYLVLRLEDVSSIVSGVGPFLLGAAVLVGAPRWPAGRRWLVAGALLSGVYGLAQLAFTLWWGWLTSMDIIPTEGAWPVVSVTLGLVQATAAALVPVCLAAGLARARPIRSLSAPLLVVPLVVGAAAVVALAGLLVRELEAASQIGEGQALYVALSVVHWALRLVGLVGLVALAVAALRAMPRTRGTPELAIAAGALVVAGSRAVTSFSQALLSVEVQSAMLVWVFTVPFLLEAVGIVILTLGFGLAALLARPDGSEADPRSPAPMTPLAG